MDRSRARGTDLADRRYRDTASATSFERPLPHEDHSGALANATRRVCECLECRPDHAPVSTIQAPRRRATSVGAGQSSGGACAANEPTSRLRLRIAVDPVGRDQDDRAALFSHDAVVFGPVVVRTARAGKHLT